jgi:hypothetical protein
MSGLTVVSREAVLRTAIRFPPPAFFNAPATAVGCLRGLSGDGASLFDAGAGIEARDALP